MLNERLLKITVLLFCLFFYNKLQAQDKTTSFSWPEGYKMALSLTFDDGRNSQIEIGLPLLDAYGAKATFLVVPSSVEQCLSGWEKAVVSGHEIGNHSTHHPCSGNFMWSRENALEEYTLEKMREELINSNKRIHELLGITPEVFAYPCGQTFVGRGIDTKSYVPVIAKLFLLGRGWLNEGPNDPAYCDMAQLTGMEMDGKDFEQILVLIESTKETGSWLVLAGHDIGTDGILTTRIAMLERLLKYALDPENGVWLAPAGTVAKYIKSKTEKAQ